ncbi:hypothetical protein EHH54_38265 [Rhizobium leguminosarum]|nr:hypothetical protein EHH54_38265 [Rhizobium leguminosarum]TAW02259.1 hypothetical protein ELI25_37310 [Rhizobium ruizarguesonis]TAY60781.1 hypothetical protein ELH84_36350 [Rhizobium ruizarguesonis]TAZ43755.1 hypothetical protein ELH76_37065 [Rhizobium ruizarguesonis]
MSRTDTRHWRSCGDEEIAEALASYKGAVQSPLAAILQSLSSLAASIDEGATGRGITRGWRPRYQRD